MIINRFLIVLCSLLLFSGNILFSQSLNKKELNGENKTKLENFIQLKTRYQNENNKVQEADYLNKIAYLFWENESSVDAVNYFKQSIEINKEIGNVNALQAIYTNIGTIYSDERMYTEAIEYFNKSLELNRKSGKKRNIWENLINIALANGEQNKFNEAIEILNEAYSIAMELNDIKLMRTCLGMLYPYYDNIGNRDKSIEYFNKFSALDKKLQQQAMSEVEQEAHQARVEKQQTEKKLKQTADTLQEISQLADIRQQQIENLNLQRELEQREQALKERERIAKQKTRRIIISAVIGVLLIILLIIYVNYKRNKKINIILAKQNKEISDQRDIIEQANKNIKNSINYAKRIQKALLPPRENLNELIPESFIFFEPRDIVSGDFYWFSKTRINSVIESEENNVNLAKTNLNNIEDGIIISAVDCTGHGVPGAFMSMIGFNLMHEIISLGITDPSKILEFLNIGIRNQLKQKDTDNRDGMDMGICLINKDKNIVQFSGAKNPLIYIKNDELNQVKGDFLPIGGFYKEEDERDYTLHTIEIDVPTTFYIFSDGFSDQIGGKECRKFLSKYFRELLFAIHKEPMETQPELLKKKFLEWMGTENTQIDDILIIGFKLYPNKN